MSTLIIYFGNHYYVFMFGKKQIRIDYDLANQYLPIIMISLIPYSFNAVYATSMREIGKTVYPTIAKCVAFIVMALHY